MAVGPRDGRVDIKCIQQRHAGVHLDLTQTAVHPRLKQQIARQRNSQPRPHTAGCLTPRPRTAARGVRQPPPSRNRTQPSLVDTTFRQNQHAEFNGMEARPVMIQPAKLSPRPFRSARPSGIERSARSARDAQSSLARNLAQTMTMVSPALGWTAITAASPRRSSKMVTYSHPVHCNVIVAMPAEFHPPPGHRQRRPSRPVTAKSRRSLPGGELRASRRKSLRSQRISLCDRKQVENEEAELRKSGWLGTCELDPLQDDINMIQPVKLSPRPSAASDYMSEIEIVHKFDQGPPRSSDDECNAGRQSVVSSALSNYDIEGWADMGDDDDADDIVVRQGTYSL